MSKAIEIAESLDAVPENGADPDLIQCAAEELRRLAQVEQELEALKDSMGEPVAQIVALGQYEFHGLEWISADHSFRATIGSQLYALSNKG